MSILPNTKNTKKKYADAKLWRISGADKHYYPSEKVSETLPKGIYMIERDANNELYFKKQTTNFDELLLLPDSTSEKIVNEIELFWTKEKEFKMMDILWKRGIMLHGPPGSGKSVTVQLICQKINKKNGIGIYVDDPYIAAKGLKILRNIEPTRPILVIFEDIDSMIDNFGEAEILSVLDGECQVNNAVFIATTNYLEKLDDRIKNRPSRFDIVKFIGYPSEASRRMFIKEKNDRLNNSENEKELDKWVIETKNLSIAHIKELIILVEIFGSSFECSLSRIKAMSHHISSNQYNNADNKFGFSK
jgi:SpoVK/Ycf46/Vps4 family AAA+-type ATPase